VTPRHSGIYIESGREETARKALAKGLSPEDVSEITGLDLETVTKIAGPEQP
jgi:hypothetical protein